MTSNLFSALQSLMNFHSKNSVNEEMHSAGTGTLDQQTQPISPTLDSKMKTTTVDESTNPFKFNNEELLCIFRKADCCTVDGLNEYDDDFTAFTPLGDLITHEMKKTTDQLVEGIEVNLNTSADLETDNHLHTTQLHRNEKQG